jgi:hypothetical protein
VTCIAGYVRGKSVWMGSDRFIGNMVEKGFVLRPKISEYEVPGSKTNMILGNAGAVRITTVIDHNMQMPPMINDVDAYIEDCFITSLRKAMWEAGYIYWENGFEQMPEGVEMLIGFRGRLFTVWDNLAVSTVRLPYACVGAGAYHANGALAALEMGAPKRTTPKARIEIALKAAALHSPWVSPPFTILEA